MITYHEQSNICYLSGSLEQQDVAELWPKRQLILGDEVHTLDLSGLRFSDSAGIAFLLSLWQTCELKGQQLKMTGASEQVNRLIALYDLQTCFE